MAAQATECHSCGTPFGWFSFKHNCKNCNKYFCADCLTHEIPIHKAAYGEGVNKMKKVCDKCHGEQVGKEQAGASQNIVTLNEFIAVEEFAKEESDSPRSAQAPEPTSFSRPHRRPSLASARSLSAVPKSGRQESRRGSVRSRTMPPGKSQATIATEDLLLQDPVVRQGSFSSRASPGSRRGEDKAAMRELLRNETMKTAPWEAKDNTVSELPQKEKYKAGDQHAAGVWPESQGPRPEAGDLSEFEGAEWEAFKETHTELAQLIYRCAEALGSKRKWENHSESLVKDLRHEVRGIAKEELKEAPGRRQVILFLVRISVRRPIFRRQAAELQELFMQ